MTSNARRCARCGRIEFAHKIPWEMDCLAFVPEERRVGERRRHIGAFEDRIVVPPSCLPHGSCHWCSRWRSGTDRRAISSSTEGVTHADSLRPKAESFTPSQGSVGGESLVERVATTEIRALRTLVAEMGEALERDDHYADGADRCPSCALVARARTVTEEGA